MKIDIFLISKITLKTKKNIHHIVWFYNFWTDRLKFLKSINKKSGFIAESFIGFKDLIIGIKNLLKTKKTILGCDDYYDIKLKNLLIRESNNYLNDSFSNLRFVGFINL